MAGSDIIGRVIDAITPGRLVGYAWVDAVNTACVNSRFSRVRAALMVRMDTANFTKPMLRCVRTELVQLQLVFTLFDPQVGCMSGYRGGIFSPTNGTITTA